MKFQGSRQASYRQNTPELIDADPALRRARDVDHAFFKTNPTARECLREMIPGEFGAGRTPAEAPAGHRLAVRVYAVIDPVSHKVIMRVRGCEVVPLSVRLEWYFDGAKTEATSR